MGKNAATRPPVKAVIRRTVKITRAKPEPEAPAAPETVRIVPRAKPDDLPRANEPAAEQPRRDPLETAENHGIAYVRMLNFDFRVVPVPATRVAGRLLEGYNLIEGESATPRFVGDPDRPDRFDEPGFVLRPRVVGPGRPNNLSEAAARWGDAMRRDRQDPGLATHRARNVLDFDWITVADQMVVKG